MGARIAAPAVASPMMMPPPPTAYPIGAQQPVPQAYPYGQQQPQYGHGQPQYPPPQQYGYGAPPPPPYGGAYGGQPHTVYVQAAEQPRRRGMDTGMAMLGGFIVGDMI